MLTKQKKVIDGIELERNTLLGLTKDLRSVLYIAGMDGNFHFITPSTEQLLGYSYHEFLVPGFWQSLIHPDDLSLVDEFYQNIHVLDEFKVSIRMRNSDGIFLLIQNSGMVKKEDGKISFIIGNLQALNQVNIFSKSKDLGHYYTEQLMDSLGLSFYAIDLKYRITAFNKIFADWMKKHTNVSYEISDSLFFSGANPKIVARYKELIERAITGEFISESIELAGQQMKIAITPVYVNNRIDGVAFLHLNKTKESKLFDSLLNLNKNVENIISSANDSIFSLDKNYCFISFNQHFKINYRQHFKADPITGLPTKHLERNDLISQKLMDYFEMALQGEDIKTEITNGGKSMLLYLKPLIDKSGNIFGVNALAKNITEIKESQKRLIESEERFKYVVDHVTDIVFQTDAQGNWTYLNNAWKQIMEFEIDETLGTLFFTYLHPDDVEKNQLLFTPLINRTKEYCSHEIRYITKSGKIKWIRVFATLLLDDNEIIGTTGTLKDITKEKENSYLFELLSNNANDMIGLHELDSSFIWASPSYFDNTGYNPDELNGKKPFEYMHPEEAAVLEKGHINFLKEEDMTICPEYRFRNKQGTYQWMEATVKSIYDNFYGRRILISTARNIDKRKEAENQMILALKTEKQLNELKSKFVSMASHEFRTPMTAIKSGAEIAEMFLKKHSGDDILKARSYIKNIDQEVDRLTLLINNILLLSRIESASLRLNKIQVDLVTTLNEIIERQTNIQEDGRGIQFTVEGVARDVFLDKLHLTHIIDNLLSNAFKYSQGCSDPELYLHFQENHFEIIIKDYGIGIPEEEQTQVFNSFFRAKNTGAVGGTGIGLVLVQNFVTMHGGTIRFESAVNRGTVFYILLPYSQ